MKSPYDRSAYGVEVRSSLIFERALELSEKVCWNPEDVGLTRVHVHPGQSREFESRSALAAFYAEKGERISEDSYRFEWLPPMKDRTASSGAVAVYAVARQEAMIPGVWRWVVAGRKQAKACERRG